MDLKLKGHNVLVTGGTKGIGRAIVEILSDEAATLRSAREMQMTSMLLSKQFLPRALRSSASN